MVRRARSIKEWWNAPNICTVEMSAQSQNMLYHSQIHLLEFANLYATIWQVSPFSLAFPKEFTMVVSLGISLTHGNHHYRDESRSSHVGNISPFLSP